MTPNPINALKIEIYNKNTPKVQKHISKNPNFSEIEKVQ